MKKNKLLLLIASSMIIFSSCTPITINNDDKGDEVDPGGEVEPEPPVVEEGTEFDIFDSNISDNDISAVSIGILKVINSLSKSRAINIKGNNSIDLKLIGSGYFKNDTSIKEFDGKLDINELTTKYDLGVSGFDFKVDGQNDFNNLVGYYSISDMVGNGTFSYELSEKSTEESETSISQKFSKKLIFDDAELKAYLKNKNLYMDLSNTKFRDSIKNSLDGTLLEQFEQIPTSFYISLEDIISQTGISFSQEDFSSSLNLLYSLDKTALDSMLRMLSSTAMNALLDKETVETIKEAFTQLDIKLYSYKSTSDKHFSIKSTLDSIEDIEFLLNVIFKDYIKQINDQIEDESQKIDIHNIIENSGLDFKDVDAVLSIDVLKSGSIDFNYDGNLKVSIDKKYSFTSDDKLNQVYLFGEMVLSNKNKTSLSFVDTSYLDKLPNDEDLNKYQFIDISVLFKNDEEIPPETEENN